MEPKVRGRFGAAVLGLLMGFGVQPALSAQLTLQQVVDALMAFSTAAGKCNKPLVDPAAPMQSIVARTGYHTADFLPGGRYVGLMDAAAEETARSIKSRGLTLTCLQAVEVAEQYLPGVLVAPQLLKAHFLWHIHGVDKLRTDKRLYRRFALDGDIARNTFVLTCPLGDQKYELEIIPPRSELPRLAALTQGGEVSTPAVFASGFRSLITAGRADPVAAWIEFRDDMLRPIVELISQRELRVSLFEAGLEYRFVLDMEGSEKVNDVFRQNRASIENSGSISTMSPDEVIRDCQAFRSRR